MALKPLRPCRHPGCRSLTRDGYCPSTNLSRRPERRRRSGTAGTACLSGPATCVPLNSCGSPGAGSASSVASVPGPPWWISWIHTRETGPSLSTGTISRACASVATTEKQRWNKRKNGGKMQAIEAVSEGGLGARPRARHARPRPPQAFGLPKTRPGRKSFMSTCIRPCGPSGEIFSPRKNGAWDEERRRSDAGTQAKTECAGGKRPEAPE